jgi:6-pyruvoyltetrahydropterin/6-carboxytetrahydropterin synthase
MYTLALKRDFAARHFLVGRDFGRENEEHPHSYTLEVILEGGSLGEDGYLVDLVKVDANLEVILSHYRNQTLNRLPEFAGLNPSIENLCRLVCEKAAQLLVAPNVSAITSRIWEDGAAWASYRMER